MSYNIASKYESNLQNYRDQFRVQIRKSHQQRNFQLMRTSLPQELSPQEYHKLLRENLAELVKARYNSNNQLEQPAITFGELQICVKNINELLKIVDAPSSLQRDLQPENYLSIILDIQNNKIGIVKDYVHSCQRMVNFVLEILLNISSLPNCRIQIGDINLEPVLQAKNVRAVCLILGILGNLILTQNQTRKKEQLYRLVCPKSQVIMSQGGKMQVQNLNNQSKQEKGVKKSIINLILWIFKRKQLILSCIQFQQYLFHFLDSFLVPLRKYNLDRSCEKQYIQLIQVSLNYLQQVLIQKVSAQEIIQSNSTFGCKKRLDKTTVKYFYLIRSIYAPLNYFPSKRILDLIQDNFHLLDRHVLWVFNQYIMREQHKIKKEAIKQIIDSSMQMGYFLADQKISTNYTSQYRNNKIQTIIYHLNILYSYMSAYPSGWNLVDSCLRKLSSSETYFRSEMPNFGVLYYIFMIDDGELKFTFLRFLRKLAEQQGNCRFLDQKLMHQIKQNSDQAFIMFQELQILHRRQALQF